MRAKLSAVVVLFVFVLAACTSGPAPRHGADTSASIPSEVLLLGTEAGPLALQVPTGAVLFERAGAELSGDGSAAYATSVEHGTTLLETLDAATGEVVDRTRIEGSLDVGVVSGGGRSVALVEPPPRGWDPRVPVPRARTSIVVADPTGAAAPRTYALEGNYEPEAFSADGRRLFLIQHLPAEAPAVYRVTTLDLRRGRVLPVFGPFKAPPERMPGVRLDTLLAPEGDQLYTLYSSSKPGYAPHQAAVASDAAVSFVHVLDLDEGWAHCIGLPKELWDRPAAEQAMAASPDGRLLYVVDVARRVAAVIDTQTLRTVGKPIEPLAPGGDVRASAVVGSGGDVLFVATGGAASTIHAIDTTTFGVEDRWSVDGAVTGLGLSSDEARLYVALEDRIAVLDAATGSELATVPVAASDEVMRVTPLAA